jgi:branched-chain amino acid transport system ATP-binding protein
MSHPLLEASGLETGYRGVQVLWRAGLTVANAETVMLLGANGAGKTTLIRAVMGLLPLWQGELRFCGADITAASTDRRVRSGIAYMSEIGCFPGLSVEENLRIGGHSRSTALIERRVNELYAMFPMIADRRKALASSLSGGQRKLLGIAKVLAGDPKLVVMDEPSAGLSPLFVDEVVRVLKQCRQQGLSLLIAEQNVKFLEVADRVYVLESGRIAFDGSVEALESNEALRTAYFGLA